MSTRSQGLESERFSREANRGDSINPRVTPLLSPLPHQGSDSCYEVLTTNTWIYHVLGDVDHDSAVPCCAIEDYFDLVLSG